MSKRTWVYGTVVVMMAVLASGSLAGSAAAAPPSWAGATTACADLADEQVKPNKIGLPTGGAEIVSAGVVDAAPRYIDGNGLTVLELPQYCRVVASIAPVDPEAYPITVNINLPVDWNGKLLQSGGGGFGGQLVSAPGNKGSGYFDPQPYDQAYPLTQGYVTFGSDTGHPRGNVDFMLNDESLRNFGGDELKKSRDTTMEVVKRFYGHRPDAVYFSGESDGGRQAMIVAQRFPKDYDVVIATSPVLSWNAMNVGYNRFRTSMIDGGFLPQDAVELIADRTREACDGLDGVSDGVVAAYQGCTMDPAVLACPSETEGGGCLTEAQMRTLDLIREGSDLPFPLANGIDVYPGTGVTGDEDRPVDQYFTYPVGTAAPTNPLPPGSATQVDRTAGTLVNFGANWLRWAVAEDPAFDPYGFDPALYQERIQYLSEIVDATDPDLSAFARHGGKILLVQPSADNAVSIRVVAEYYESVVQELGADTVSEFFRFYVTPGGAHNVTGIGHVDALGVADAWFADSVEPPAMLTAIEQDPATLDVLRSMPACQWPAYPHYDGTGDTTDAANFVCTPRESPLE